MKHIIAYSFFVAAAIAVTALPASAATMNWATVETQAADGDDIPGLDSVRFYSAYYMSADTAQELFKTTLAADITTYLQKNYDTGKSAVAGSGTELTAGNFGVAQYSFTEYSTSAIADTDYLAILFYENGDARWFRVFGTDSVTKYDSNLVFDDSDPAASGIEPWTEAEAIPEPTSALLLLLGISGLALRRRKV